MGWKLLGFVNKKHSWLSKSSLQKDHWIINFAAFILGEEFWHQIILDYFFQRVSETKGFWFFVIFQKINMSSLWKCWFFIFFLQFYIIRCQYITLCSTWSWVNKLYWESMTSSICCLNISSNCNQYILNQREVWWMKPRAFSWMFFLVLYVFVLLFWTFNLNRPSCISVTSQPKTLKCKMLE